MKGCSAQRLHPQHLTKAQMLFSASITWGTQSRPVTVNVVDKGDPLIGGGLLHGYTLFVDFQQKRLTIKEPGTDDPQVTDSVESTEQES